MTKEEVQQMAFEMIAASGDALDCYYSAIVQFRNNNIDEAKQKIKDGNTCLNKTHQIQTDLIQAEIKNEEVPYSLIMTHAQDHLTNAMNWERLARLVIMDS